jgi:hypothetical protein
MEVNVIDAPSTDISVYFDDVNEFISEARAGGGKVIRLNYLFCLFCVSVKNDIIVAAVIRCLSIVSAVSVDLQRLFLLTSAVLKSQGR